jgi:hypothetical protein
MHTKLQSLLAKRWRSLVGDRQLDRIRAVERRLTAIDHDLRSTMGYSHATPISEVLRTVASAVAALGTDERHGGGMTRSEVGNALISLVLEFLAPGRLLPLSQRIGEDLSTAFMAEIKELSAVAVELMKQ